MIETEKLTIILEKPEMAEGLRKYQKIMEAINLTDVSKDAAFQKMYRNFYRMNRFYSDEFAHAYFKIMEHLKSSPIISFEMALERVKHIKGSYEISFSSKLAHSIDPKLPIWDKIVTKDHFHLRAPSVSRNNRERACCKRYDDYRKRFYAYLNSPEGQLLIEEFDAAFPDNGISNVKKVDFILWQDR